MLQLTAETIDAKPEPAVVTTFIRDTATTSLHLPVEFEYGDGEIRMYVRRLGGHSTEIILDLHAGNLQILACTPEDDAPRAVLHLPLPQF